MPPGVYKVVDNHITKNDFLKKKVATHDVTVKTNLKTNHILRFDEKSFSGILLGLVPNVDYMPNQRFFRKKFENMRSKGRIDSKCDCKNGWKLVAAHDLVLCIFSLDKPPAYIIFR